MNLQPRLQTTLARLMPLTSNDFESLFAKASDPQIWELHPQKDRYKKEIFQDYFASALASQSAFLIYDNQTNEIIGCTRFYDYKPEQSSIAIGYTFLVTKCWGGEYNRAVKTLLLDYAFQFVNAVLFHVGSGNFRSQKALLKIGAKKIGEVAAPIPGEPPHFEYEIRKEAWFKIADPVINRE